MNAHHGVYAVPVFERAEQALSVSVHGALKQQRVDDLALTTRGRQTHELRHFRSRAHLLRLEQALERTSKYSQTLIRQKRVTTSCDCSDCSSYLQTLVLLEHLQRDLSVVTHDCAVQSRVALHVANAGLRIESKQQQQHYCVCWFFRVGRC